MVVLAALNDIINQLAGLPTGTLANTIVAALKDRTDFIPAAQATLVRILNAAPPTMHGGTAVDSLSDADPAARLGYDISPFPKLTGGAVITAVAEDKQGELYVLLGRKSEDKPWEVPAGHFAPKPTHSALGVYTVDTHERDPFENKVSADPTFHSDKPIQTLSNTLPTYDHSFAENAARELREETGLTLDPAKFQYVEMVMPISGERQTVETNFLVDLRMMDLPRDERGLPIVSDNDDLKNLRWVKIADIEETKKNNKPSYHFTDNNSGHAMPIHLRQGKHIADALHQLRKQEVEKFGVTIDVIRENFSTEKRPDTEFGQTAIDWHKEALNTAEIMQRRLLSLKDKASEKSLTASHSQGLAV